MERIVFCFGFLAILNASVAASINSVDPLENFIEPRAVYYGNGPARNGLIIKVQCVVETIDQLVIEYHTQSIWQDVQTKLHGNIGNLLGCLRYNGFAVQGCVAKEVIGLGLVMNSFLSRMDSESSEGGKQLRLRLAGNCSN